MVAKNEVNTHGLVKRPLWRSHGVEYVAVTDRIPDHSPGDVITGVSKRMLRYYFCHFHCGPKDCEWTELAIKQFKFDGKRRTRYISTQSRTNYKQFTEPQRVKEKEANRRRLLNEDAPAHVNQRDMSVESTETTADPKDKFVENPKDSTETTETTTTSTPVATKPKPKAKPKVKAKPKATIKRVKTFEGDD